MLDKPITGNSPVQSYCSVLEPDLSKRVRDAVFHRNRKLIRSCGHALNDLGGVGAMRAAYWAVGLITDELTDKIIFEEWGRILIKEDLP
jgi:hypothetical protein